MRATSVTRSVVLGAAGFALGGVFVGALGDAMFAGFFVMGALGGASLGLAENEMRRTVTLALMGALGFGVGFLVAFAIVLLVWDPFDNWFVGAVGGALGGASLGIGAKDWRKTATLTVAGAVGFGAGWGVTDVFLQGLYEGLGNPRPPLEWVFVILSAVAGLMGGASVGAVLGYLEDREPNKERRPRFPIGRKP